MTSSPYQTGLELDDVAVMRGGSVIVAGASACLAPGDALVLTGPNGSGKTSLLRAVAGFVRHEGTIALTRAGETLAPAEAAALMHFVGHDSGLTRRQDAAAHLAFWQKLLGTGTGPSPETVTKRMALPAGPVWQFSAGQQRRLALARLIAVPRPVWLLDEPVTALDPAGRALLAELCTEHRGAGGVIISTSHGLLDLPGALQMALARPDSLDGAA